MRSSQEHIIINIPQRDPLRKGDVRKLEREFSAAAHVVNNIAGDEILRVQSSGRSLYVVVRDPSESVEGFTYSFELSGCKRIRIGSQALNPDVLNWTEACEHVVARLTLLLNTIAERLTRQAADARSIARSFRVLSQRSHRS